MAFLVVSLLQVLKDHKRVARGPDDPFLPNQNPIPVLTAPTTMWRAFLETTVRCGRGIWPSTIAGSPTTWCACSGGPGASCDVTLSVVTDLVHLADTDVLSAAGDRASTYRTSSPTCRIRAPTRPSGRTHDHETAVCVRQATVIAPRL